MSYGVEIEGVYRRSAAYVDRLDRVRSWVDLSRLITDTREWRESADFVAKSRGCLWREVLIQSSWGQGDLAMMGERTVVQGALFYEFSLERHLPADQLLRSIDRFVDLSGIRAHLEPFYSEIGRPSIDPSC